MARFEPVIAINIFMVIVIILLFFLDDEGAFNKFMHFGPEQNTKFLNMKLDTWSKVGLVYIVSFTAAYLGNFFYTNIQSGFLGSKLINPSVKELDMTRNEARYVIYLSSISFWSLQIIQFMVTLTMQLQFMVFGLLGNMASGIPFYLSHLDEKKTKS